MKNLTIDEIMTCLCDGGEMRESPYLYNTKGSHTKGLGACAFVVTRDGVDIGSVHWRSQRYLLKNGFIKHGGGWCIDPQYKHIELKRYIAVDTSGFQRGLQELKTNPQYQSELTKLNNLLSSVDTNGAGNAR
jgi:hypothetical protein